MDYFLTGGTGFLGKTLANRLKSDGNRVFDLNDGSSPRIDIREAFVLPEGCNADVVIHAAGKAHVIPKTAAESKSFYDVNVSGTRNLLQALTFSPPKSFVFISSVAVYGRISGILISEESPLLAKDPYGQSKIQAEKLVQEWCTEHKVICTILRLPILVGPDPIGNLKAMIEGIKKGYYFEIDGGKARKSMVSAQEVAAIISPASVIGGIYNLTDRYHPSFSELSAEIAKQLKKGKPLNIPRWLAYLFSIGGNLLGKSAPINSLKLAKITSDLTFSDEKAVRYLNWNPTPVIKNFTLTSIV